MFLCTFNCDFPNEDEDIFLIHLTENCGFSKWAPHQENYEACHLCTFICSMKNELAEHTSEVHQIHWKLDNTSDNPIISQLKADNKGLSHVKF